MEITADQLALLKKRVKALEKSLTEIKDVIRDVERGAAVNGNNGDHGHNGFHPPTLVEIAAYCGERNNHIDPQTFLDYYESRGWRIGEKNKMKDWKAAIRTWENRRKPTNGNGSAGIRNLFPVDPRGNLATAQRILDRMDDDEDYQS